MVTSRRTSAPAPQLAAGARLAEPVRTALDSSEPLGVLLKRLRESQARFEAVAPSLPAELRGVVRPGPLDDSCWVLLVDHSAAAAKLRQCLPGLEALLQQAGWVGPAMKVKVRPRLEG